MKPIRDRVCATVLALVACAAGAQAQTVTKVRGAETIEISGIGKVQLAGIAPPGNPVRFGPSGPTPPPRSGPDRPPPIAIGGRINLAPDRSAEQFLQKLVLGKRVRIEYDDAGKERPEVPRVYVFLEDGTLVNAEMLREGKARVDASEPIARLDEFKTIEEEARGNQRGIWAEPGRRR